VPVVETKRWTKPAQGFAHRQRFRLVCDLDADTLEEVRAFAKKEKTSVGAQIRLLIEWGLMAVNEE
jgi:hypothetical protein